MCSCLWSGDLWVGNSYQFSQKAKVSYVQNMYPSMQRVLNLPQLFASWEVWSQVSYQTQRLYHIPQLAETVNKCSIKLQVITLKEAESNKFKGSSIQFTCCIASTVIRIALSWLPADVSVIWTACGEAWWITLPPTWISSANRERI